MSPTENELFHSRCAELMVGALNCADSVAFTDYLNSLDHGEAKKLCVALFGFVNGAISDKGDGYRDRLIARVDQDVIR